MGAVSLSSTTIIFFFSTHFHYVLKKGGKNKIENRAKIENFFLLLFDLFPKQIQLRTVRALCDKGRRNVGKEEVKKKAYEYGCGGVRILGLIRKEWIKKNLLSWNEF